MEDDIDIYGDLPSFGGKENECCIQKNKELTKKCATLEHQITELKLKITTSEHDISTLKLNVSSLLKTAKAEISRKDRMISELRQQLDNAAFRRGNFKKPKIHSKHHSDRKEQEIIEKNPNASMDIKSEQLHSFAEPILSSSSDNETENSEQKYKPEKKITTLFGERLKKRIIMEDEAERMKKEEMKVIVPNNTIPVVVKEENPQSINVDIKKELEPEDIPLALNTKAIHSRGSSIPSSIGSLQLYTEHENNSKYRDKKLYTRIGYEDPTYSYQKRRRIENDGYQKEVTRFPGDDYRHSDSFQMERDENYHRWRDSEKYMEIRGKSYYPEEFQSTREARRDRHNSHYRSRTMTPDRRRNERRTERYYTDTHKIYDEKYDNRRDETPSRGNGSSNDFKKDLVDLRNKINHRSDSKASGRNGGLNNQKNRDSDHYYERRSLTKSRSPEKRRSSSRCSKSNSEIDKRRSRSGDRLGSAKSRTEKSLKPSTEARTNSKDRKIVKVEAELPEISSKSADLPSSGPNLRKSTEAREILDPDDAQQNTNECNDEAAIVTEENTTSNGDAQDKWISVFENDSEVPLIPEHRTSSPKPEEPGSRSFREEKIENIEKFIQDYQNNECLCPSLLIEEAEPDGPYDDNKSGNTTSGIVDTLSMDIECVTTIGNLVEDIVENPVIAKPLPSPPLESLNETRIEIDVRQEVTKNNFDIEESPIENIVSNETKIQDDLPSPALEISVETTAPQEIMDVKSETESLQTEINAPKETNKLSRIPCIAIMSKYSKKKHEMVLTDSGSSHCIVKSQSPQRIVTSPTETNNNIQDTVVKDSQAVQEESKDLPKVSNEDISELTVSNLGNSNIQLSENSAEMEFETQSENPSCTVTTGNSIHDLVEPTNNSQPANQEIPLTNVTTVKSDIHLEQSETIENVLTVSRSEDNSKKTVVSLLEENTTAEEKSTPSGNSESRSMELRGTRAALKAIVPSTSSPESILCNRKRPLPKEKENQSKPVAKQCKITVIARRRRPVVLEDSSSSVILVSSVISNEIESGKNSNTKTDKVGVGKPVTEASTKGRPKRRPTDK